MAHTRGQRGERVRYLSGRVVVGLMDRHCRPAAVRFERCSTILYCSTDSLSGCGVAVKNLSHSWSLRREISWDQKASQLLCQRLHKVDDFLLQ